MFEAYTDFARYKELIKNLRLNSWSWFFGSGFVLVGFFFGREDACGCFCGFGFCSWGFGFGGVFFPFFFSYSS